MTSRAFDGPEEQPQLPTSANADLVHLMELLPVAPWQRNVELKRYASVLSVRYVLRMILSETTIPGRFLESDRAHLRMDFERIRAKPGRKHVPRPLSKFRSFERNCGHHESEGERLSQWPCPFLYCYRWSD
jgi:hypothetical protein